MDATYDPDCLHCVVSRRIARFFAERRPRDPATGQPLIGTGELTAGLIEVVVDVCMKLPDLRERAMAIADAHEQIDALIQRKYPGDALAGLPDLATAH